MKYKRLLLISGIVPCFPATADEPAQTDTYLGEDMIITTAHKLFPNTTIATPKFEITKEDIDKTNLTSAEDAIRMAPSVQVRRRFYGDTNGVTAIRGSTNFQTGHFNMYVDGLPLHNAVQTKWNGAPKWNLIAPNAIESTSVMYGPYSAEHRGAFGGTFDLKTRLPEKFEMSVDVTGIIQDSHRYGKDEVLTGHKEFISAGNRFGDWSIYAFYNHLENEGQPQSFSAPNNDGSRPAIVPGTGGTAVRGAHATRTNLGNQSYITGDLGINENITDLYELKVGYDLNPDLRALFTIAFEDTERNNQSRSYLKDMNGNTIWNGTVNQDGYEFAANPTRFGNPTLTGSENERQTLAYGFNLSGKLTEDWSIDTTASFFDAFKDETRNSKYSRNDPNYGSAADGRSGNITDIEVWWVDYSLKLATQNLFDNEDLGFMFGYQYNHSFLDIDKYNTDNVYAGDREDQIDADGGSTGMHSAFMQADWDFLDNWNILAGMRYDHWYTARGHVNKTDIKDRELDRVSPKTSLSYRPLNDVTLRYSFSRAYRFALAEELFDSSTNTNAINISDPTLAPEAGNFHDFSVRYDISGGYVSASLFYNEIENEIMQTTTLIAGGKTANRTRGIDQTETIGVELVYRQDNIMDLPFGLDLNGTWLNKEIKEDKNNPNLVDKEWIRIPQWRANGTLTYHTTQEWDNILALQYRSKQYNQADNSDQDFEVYGSSSDYVLLNFKSAYKMDVGNGMKARFSIGVDNLLDEAYYEHHPYPRRTFFANVGLDI